MSAIDAKDPLVKKIKVFLRDIKTMIPSACSQ
jgi:hypothetical protein